MDEQADLVTLTTAVPNDRALVLNTAAGGPEEIWLLWTADPTVATNWQNITGSGGDIGAVTSVNGMQGAVTVDLDNLPNVQNALDDKADASNAVTLTGTQTITGSKTFSGINVPTAATTSNDTTAASTAFVKTAASNYLPLTGGTITGPLKIPLSQGISFGTTTGPNLIEFYRSTTTDDVYGIGIESGTIRYNTAPSRQHKWYAGDTTLGYWNTTDLYVGSTGVKTTLATKANLASPALTGNPTAPTQAVGDDSTRLATTAFVQDAVAASGGGGGVLSSKGTRSTTGRWSISGLTANKPVYLTFSTISSGSAYAYYLIVSGISPASASITRVIGAPVNSSEADSMTHVIIPSATTLIIDIDAISGSSPLLTVRQ